MLKNSKSITLNSSSMINDVKVIDLSATIDDLTKVGSINQYIQNTELYETNRAEVRKDIAEFQNMVYAVEDELLAKIVK